MQNRTPTTPNDSDNQTEPTIRYLFGIFWYSIGEKVAEENEIKQHLPPEEVRRLYKKEKDKKRPYAF